MKLNRAVQECPRDRPAGPVPGERQPGRCGYAGRLWRQGALWPSGNVDLKGKAPTTKAASETGRLSLYNVASDIGETNDLSEREPAKVAELLGKLEAWRDDVGTDPMKPNPEYEGARP